MGHPARIFRRSAGRWPGDRVALFLVAIVGLVVGQTWLEWRDTRRQVILPDWARGLGLAGLLAAPLAAGTSFASALCEDTLGQAGRGIEAWVWLELGFLLSALGIITAAVHRKRLRMLIILSCILTAAFWFTLANS